MDIRFINANIITGEPGRFVIKNAELAVRGDHIEYVGRVRKSVCADAQHKGEYEKTVDVGGDVLMPGFVNAHCHMAMTLLKGRGEERGLDSWLHDIIFPLEAGLDEEAVYFGTMLAAMECVAGGTTFVGDSYYYNKSVFAAAKKSGLGIAILGAEMDTEKPAAKIVDNAARDFESYNGRHSNIKYIPGCHSVYTCSRGLLEGIADLCAQLRVFPYIHLSETLEEVGNCTAANNGLTPPQYLHKLGYFDNGGVCAHVVHADKDDLLLLKQCGVSAVHCPASNLKLGSGIAPVFSMLKTGVNMGLGTDGSASNNALDMFREMYLCSVLQKGVMNMSTAVTANQAISAATWGGANALGLEGRGMLRPGFKADVIRVSMKGPHLMPAPDDYAAAVVYSAKSSDVVMTMVDGKILYLDGNFYIGEKPEYVYKKCATALKKLLSKI